MKICMAAAYDVTDRKSWSGTPYSLYRTLCKTDNEITTLDLSAYHTPASKRLNMLRHMDIISSLKSRSPVSKIGMSAMNPLNSSILHKHCHKGDCDALLEFGGFLPGKDLPPYYVYSDSSHDLSLDFYNQKGYLPFGYMDSDLENVRRAAAFVKQIYLNAQGVFCMSQWMADSMINTTGVPQEKVHVVYAGSNWHEDVRPSGIKARTLNESKEIHMLLTGVEFKRKGIDLAIEATDILNKESEIRYHLHVCGIKNEFPHGEFVHNHGFVDKTQLTDLLRRCDLFVLPSRFDFFGIAFIEAMAFGLPCVGRDICAMPEIIGESGELITKDDPAELAEKITSICGDPEKYAGYSENAIRQASLFTWENTAQKMLKVMENDLL